MIRFIISISRLFYFALFGFCLPLLAVAQTRLSFNISDWEFSRDSIHWQQVSIPHDWAISGPFDKKWDLQSVAITANGETTATEKSGRSGALPWIGEGWYRTVVNINDGLPSHELVFDGAMAEPTVYINNVKAAYWAYGYNRFRIDCDKFFHKGKNKIMVHLQNMAESSRWYPGAGLYRPVTITARNKNHIDDWSVSFRTDSISNGNAYVSVEGRGSDNAQDIEFDIVDNNGKSVGRQRQSADATGLAKASFIINAPKLWSPESPYLYTLSTKLYNGNTVEDESLCKVGIRTIKIDSVNGFQLNGITRKLQGVCLHHDLGSIGTAVHRDALLRQLLMMKDLGADAIRTAHNMPSQMQMELCDSIGLMVMAESFDMWNSPKCKNGYCRFFKDWSDKDITNLILANRNHPSIIMWSIGNEIPEQGSTRTGLPVARHLQELCHRLDPTRPVTQGLHKAEAALSSGVAQLMDVSGFNYRVFKYNKNIKQLPQGFLLGSETGSTVSSRGVYKFPVVWGADKTYTDGQSNGYDTECCSWSNLPEEDFIAQEDAPYTIGQFVWAGFDYLGEPTPYDGYWPSRSSYFGLVDLAGIPKDRYYLYRSVWNKKSHTLHVLPHWTWPGREGEVTPVFCYTDYPSAELFVNGKSQGRLYKDKTVKGSWETGTKAKPEESMKRAARYRLMWNNVKYEPGEIKIVAYDDNGVKAEEKTVRTAGKADHLKFETFFAKDGILKGNNRLEYVAISLCDKDGNVLPTADDELEFEVSGAATFRGVCNGDPTSLEVFTAPRMRLFSGKLVVTIETKRQKGKIVLKAKDKDNPSINGKCALYHTFTSLPQ